MSPLGVNPAGKCTRKPMARSAIFSFSGLSTRSLDTRTALSLLGARIVCRLLTIVTKFSWAARRHSVSLAKYHGGKVYPAAHVLADASSKSFFAASDASYSNERTLTSVAILSSAKYDFAQATMEGARRPEHCSSGWPRCFTIEGFPVLMTLVILPP